MKTRLKLRIIWDSTITKVVLSIFIVSLLILAIILPSILTSMPDGAILAFNRDAVSGTREAFVEKVLDEDKHTWSPGSNVREVRNNDSMITFVQREEDSVGYVSFGTIAYFDELGNPQLRTDRNGMDNISFSTFEGVVPTYDNILDGTYSASRNFNAFLRVKEGSDEYEITNFDWDNGTIDQSSLATINGVKNSNDLKAAYLFFNWFTRSTEAEEIINESGEIPYSLLEQNGSTRVQFFSDYDETTGEYSDDWNDTMVQHYIDATNLNSDDQILIEIVGSTSATALMTDLTNSFDEVVSEHYGLKEEALKFVIATNGSSDAISPNPPAGTDHPFIGMQSKDQDVSGLSTWGENYAVEELDGSITYNNNVYTPFAKDAILIIFNNENTQVEINELNVSREAIHSLYTYNEYMYAEDLFTSNKRGGS